MALGTEFQTFVPSAFLMLHQTPFSNRSTRGFINGHLQLSFALPKTFEKTLNPFISTVSSSLCILKRSEFSLRTHDAPQLSQSPTPFNAHLIIEGTSFTSSVDICCILTNSHHPLSVWCIRCGLFPPLLPSRNLGLCLPLHLSQRTPVRSFSFIRPQSSRSL